MREFRVIGPPGTGKTHFLARQVKAAASKFGGQSVAVCSLTRTAAAEVAGRLENLPPRNIGTLHALAYRAVGEGRKVAEDCAAGWNDRNDVAWHIGGGWDQSPDDPLDRDRRGPGGDAILAEIGRMRAGLTPLDQWSDGARGFWVEWQKWKNELGLLDFSDMIDAAWERADTAPGDPAALLVDEAQDLSAASWRLVRKWGEKALVFVVVGDPDQCLFSWCGVDVRAFGAVPLPPEQLRVLAQSYRVPRRVHAHATKWIERTPGRLRIEYQPTAEAGSVAVSRADYLRCADLARAAGDHAAEGRSVMFLASCGFMLAPIIRELKSGGVPFHNPWRVKRGDWNPLRTAEGKISAAQRVMAWLRGQRAAPDNYHRVRDLAAVAAWLKVDGGDDGDGSGMLFGGGTTAAAATGRLGICRGARGLLKRLMESDPDAVVDGELFRAVLGSEWLRAIDGDLKWLAESTLEAHRAAIDYPIAIARRMGEDGLTGRPLVSVSTIHAAKGAEADIVYLFPDLSRAGMGEWAGGDGSDGREGLRRMFYVAMTRARERLVICRPARGGEGVDLG